jgi:hypothetical protein
MISATILLTIFCVSVVISIRYWQRTKKKKYIFLIPGFTLLVFLSPFILFLVEYSKLFYCPNPFDNKLELIELDRLKTFFEKDGEWYYTVLIRNPPEDADSIKKIMAQYFIEKQSYIDSVTPGHYLSSVKFYKYTCETGYFINNDEAPGTFFSETINMYQDARIGFIFARSSCDNDSAKYEDIMEVRNEERDTLRSECDGVYIDNWDMYIK